MTQHVITRWYRPPELMLCPDGLYTFAVDMWSCGTIFAEILLKVPLFPGKNFVHQLSIIFDVIGSPQFDEVSHIKNNQAIKFLESQKLKIRQDFNLIFKGCNESIINLISGLLVFDPNHRLTVDQALDTDFMTDVKSNSPSLSFPPVSPDFEFSFESMNLTRNQLKKLIYDEVESLKSEKFSNKDILSEAIKLTPSKAKNNIETERPISGKVKQNSQTQNINSNCITNNLKSRQLNRQSGLDFDRNNINQTCKNIKNEQLINNSGRKEITNLTNKKIERSKSASKTKSINNTDQLVKGLVNCYSKKNNINDKPKDKPSTANETKRSSTTERTRFLNKNKPSF